ncbi:MAG: hypothetical protein CBE10_03030 [bacterium TMED250]|nr:MAG: hypothetical protein CBE10_03030 [bacterium TMED250]|tara:strand:- start:1262 stop:2035 length:774 start_codon:yes stop_codon:yes gene_type:complete
MNSKTYALITDIHSNSVALKKGLEIINSRDDIDKIIFLGDYFSLGPEPKEILDILKSKTESILIRGNHERYLLEKIWNDDEPSLEGMPQDDPLLHEIVDNEKWTAEQIGDEGIEFCNAMTISNRQIVGNTLVEFCHAWYERDEIPPTMEEALQWRDEISKKNPEIEQFIIVHGHLHIPREESKENIKILCQGATGLPFDEDPRGALAFLTVGDSFQWNIIRFEYDSQSTIDMLEQRQPPFYKNLQNTVRYAAIRNDI